MTQVFISYRHIFLDEAALIFKYDYRDHFFSLIRGWRNLRVTNENWTRLNLIIAHSTEPNLWIQDINQSPVNVGFCQLYAEYFKHHLG